MAYIKDIQIGDNTYLIEPLLYTSAVLNSNNTYIATLNNYNIISGSFIYLEISDTNNTAPKLNVNNTGAKDILYENTNLQANMLIPGHIYNFIYNGTAWVILGDLGNLPLAANGVRGGVQIGYTTNNENKNYAVQLDQEKMYVHVPWTGTSSWSEISGKPTTLAGYGITDATIVDDTLTLGPYSSTLVTSVNGDIGDVIITAADLGLSNALHFIGITSTTLTDGSTISTLTPKSDNSLSKTTEFVNGDVVMDNYQLREYVFVDGAWVLLGYTTSQIYDSDSATPSSEDIPTWISRVTQATDGSIQIERKTIGILPIEHGGTGASSFNANAVIISTSPGAGETMTLTSRAYSDSTSAEALVSTSTNFVTERDIYFGLPRINNLHNYTSDSDIYAPTTSGEQYQLLVSNDTGNAPVWAIAATVQSEVSTTADVAAYTTLTLGNQINVTSATAHSEGQIWLYSAATHAHILQGASTAADYTHILPNSNGYLVQTASAAAVGSPTNPVYIAANGIVTALTYTANRLYFSAATNSFEATNHYADADHIGLGATAWPIDCEDTLYVTGTSTFNNNIRLLDHIYFGQPASSEDPQYYIDSSAIGFLSDLRVDNVQLDDNYIKFYQGINAGTSLYGSIQGTATRLIFNWATTDPLPAFEFNGDLLPSINNDSNIVYNLGAADNTWAKLYIGTDSSYGDAYTPIYWNDGAPAAVVPIQYCQFTIKSSTVGVTLTHEAFTENSYVLQIVVTSGESNLNSQIRWASYSSGELALFCLTPPSGDVSGYILVSRGGSITPQSADLTRLPPPPVDPPTPPPVDPPTPEPEGE